MKLLSLIQIAPAIQNPWSFLFAVLVIGLWLWIGRR